jgi:hypothetical protein
MPNNSVILSGAGGNNSYPLQGQVIQNLNGYPPSYDHTGAPTTSHTVSSTVIGTATSTTVTLVGKSAFSNANYFLSVTDETSHTTATITHKAPTYFVFSSTAEHTYTYFASGT